MQQEAARAIIEKRKKIRSYTQWLYGCHKDANGTTPIMWLTQWLKRRFGFDMTIGDREYMVVQFEAMGCTVVSWGQHALLKGISIGSRRNSKKIVNKFIKANQKCQAKKRHLSVVNQPTQNSNAD